MSYTPDADLISTAAAGQPEAQYRLGAGYFAGGEIRAALEWLTRAADRDVPDAQNMLGVILRKRYRGSLSAVKGLGTIRRGCATWPQRVTF